MADVEVKGAPEGSGADKVEDVASAVKAAAEKIGHFLHKAEIEVSDEFVKLVGKPQAQAFAHAAVVVLQSAAGKIALDVVANLESLKPALDGAAKREQAQTQLKNDLKSAESNVPNALINILIEAAVAAVKGYIVLP